jgi:c-di-GMP-binding flagellar brake protein YcgR
MTMTTARRYERAAFFCKAAVAIPPGAKPAEAHTFDLSLGGVGLYAQTPVQRGRPVMVSFFLNTPRGEVVEHVAGQIAYVKADETGTRIGIEFQEPLRDSANPELTHRLERL